MKLYDWRIFLYDEWARFSLDRSKVAGIIERGKFHWFIDERFVCEPINLIVSRDLSFEEFVDAIVKPTHALSGRSDTLLEAQAECDAALSLLGFEFIDPKFQVLK